MANGTAGGSVFFGYLGSLLVKAGGASTMTPPPRQRTFLAVLLTRAGRPVTIDELAEFVWDGTPPDRAADTLRTYVMRLRRVLGDEAGARIVTRDPGYLINVTEDEVDALRFARACREGAGPASGPAPAPRWPTGSRSGAVTRSPTSRLSCCEMPRSRRCTGSGYRRCNGGSTRTCGWAAARS
jgi:hypothetical protein